MNPTTRHNSISAHPTMSVGVGAAPGWLLFGRIVDVPFEAILAALEAWPRTGQDGDRHIGGSVLRGPGEHDPGTGTCRLQVRLARGPLRPPLPMRLDIDRWSVSATAIQLIPGRGVRPTAAYFRAGHRLLDSLTQYLSQPVPPAQSPRHHEPAAADPGRP